MKLSEIISSTQLVDTCKGDFNVQLRKASDGYYMVSPITGIHFIYEKTYNDRVQAHWEGFQHNQAKAFHLIIGDIK